MTSADQTAGAERPDEDAATENAKSDAPAVGASPSLRIALPSSYADVLRDSVDWLWQTDAELTLTYISHPLAEEPEGPSQIWLGRSLAGLADSEAVLSTPSPLLTALKERRAFRDCVVDWTPDQERTVRFRLTGLPFYEEGTGRFAGFRGTGSATIAGRPSGSARKLSSATYSA